MALPEAMAMHCMAMDTSVLAPGTWLLPAQFRPRLQMVRRLRKSDPLEILTGLPAEYLTRQTLLPQLSTTQNPRFPQ